MISDPHCRRCPLSQGANTVCIAGDGPPQADIMIIGEAPGADEDRLGRPFVGAAGRLLDDLLSQAGLSRSQVYITNTARCRPPQNRKPTDAERAACRIYTLREIEQVKPKVIIALGGSAAKELVGSTKVGDARGRMRPLVAAYRSDVRVIVTYHPAAALHNPAEGQSRYLGAIRSDFELARRYVAPSATVEPEMTLGVGDKVSAALARLSRADKLACDTEWEAKVGMWPWSRPHGRKARLVSIALAGRVDGQLEIVAVPYGSRHDAEVGELLAAIPSVYHHMTADLLWLYDARFTPQPVGDTLITASLLNLESSHSLKTLAALHTETPAGWEVEVDDKVGTFPRTKAEWLSMLRYNGWDAGATLLLDDTLMAKLVNERPGVVGFYRQALIPACDQLVRTALNGAPFDRHKLEKVEIKERREMVRLGNEIGDALDLGDRWPDVVFSRDKLSDALAGAGLPLGRTRTGKASTAAGELSGLRSSHPVVTPLLSFKKHEKNYGTYVKPWLRSLYEQGDGRLHTIYKLHVARTGRSSAENEYGGHLQNIPKGPMRKLIKARPGWSIMSADLSQIELRVAAWLAGEQRMLEAFRTGDDIHDLTGGWMVAYTELGWTDVEDYVRRRGEIKVSKGRRQSAKAYNFGCLFGGRESTLIRSAQKDYGVALSYEQAKVGREGWFQLFADLPAWHDAAWRYVKQGYVDTPFGRRRMLYLTEDEDDEARLRKAINTPVQATASDITLTALARFGAVVSGDGLATRALMVGYVHDELVLEVENSVIETAGYYLKDAMEHPGLERFGIDFDVPLVAEVAVGPTWYDTRAVAVEQALTKV